MQCPTLTPVSCSSYGSPLPGGPKASEVVINDAVSPDGMRRMKFSNTYKSRAWWWLNGSKSPVSPLQRPQTRKRLFASVILVHLKMYHQGLSCSKSRLGRSAGLRRRPWLLFYALINWSQRKALPPLASATTIGLQPGGNPNLRNTRSSSALLPKKKFVGQGCY